MTFNMRRSVAFGAVCLALVEMSFAADRTRDLIRYAPDSANVIGVVRVEEILNGRRARREQWGDQQKNKFLAGSAVIPPWASTAVFAAHVQPEIPKQDWNVLLLAWPGNVDLAQIAKREQSQVESLAGTSVVRAHRDAYYVSPAANILATRSPASRTDVARWIRTFASTADSNLSAYLRNAASSPAHIVLAMDLQDAVDPDRARQRLRELNDASLSDADIDRLVNLAQSLQGIRCEVNVGNTTDAELSIDFGASIGDAGDRIKNITLELLSHHGLNLPELAKCQARGDEKSVTLRTELSDASLRKVLSLLVAPNPQQVAGAAPDAKPADPASPAETNAPDPKASRDYFAAVDMALNDAERPSWSNTNSGTEGWLARFATKIDNLSITGVDPELAAYGASISSKLRALAASLRGVDIDVDTQEGTITYNTEYDPGWSYLGWWGAVGYRAPSYKVTSNVEEVRKKQAATIEQGTKTREDLWQRIDDERNKVRLKMQQKYGQDFGAPQ